MFIIRNGANRRRLVAPPRFVLFTLLAFATRYADASYAIDVPHGESECFKVRVSSSGKSFISGSYDILDDGIDGSLIKVSLKNAKNNDALWTSKPEHAEGTFQVQVEAGRYKFCIESEVDEEEEELERDVTSIGFSLRWKDMPRSLEEGEDGPEALRALELVGMAAGVQSDWENLLDHFDFLRNREGIHTNMIQSIFTRLLRWTIIEAVLVVLMATAQVIYLKKFFEQTRYL